MRKIFVCLSLCCLSLVAYNQDTTFVRQIVSDLSSPEMFGRGYSYNGANIAADYLKKSFEKLNILPLCDEFLQCYEFVAPSMEGDVELILDKKTLTPFDEYRIAPYSKSTDGKFKIVYVDVASAVDSVYQLAFQEKYKNKLEKIFVYINADDYDKTDKVLSDSVKKFLRNVSVENPFKTSGVLLGVENLPVWGFSNTDFERNHAVIYVLNDVMRSEPKYLRTKFTVEFNNNKSYNVCGYVKGTQQPDSMIVFTAHYDHLGIMGDDVLFPGAHDNASGTAAVIDFARYFKDNPHRYSTVFLLFSGEEAGIRGSSFFVENSLIDLSKVKYLINIDLFCGGDDGITLVNSKSEKTVGLYNRMVALNDEYQFIKEVKQRDNAANSDHYPFSKYCPAIFIYTMGGRTGDYHNINDTCENCSLEHYISMFRLILESVGN